MRDLCAEMGCELREFNGENDHVHLLVHYPPKLPVSTLVNRLKAYQRTTCGKSSPAPPAGHFLHGHLWSPSYFAAPRVAHRPQSSSSTSSSRSTPLRPQPMRSLPALNGRDSSHALLKATGMTRSPNRCDVTITVDSDGRSLNAHRPDDSQTRHPDDGVCST